MQKELPIERLVFLDESCAKTNMTRLRGRFAAADDGGTSIQGGSSSSKYPPAPDRIKVDEADAKLIEGHTSKDCDEEAIHFGMALKTKLEKSSDCNERKEHLLWAIKAVETGKKTHVVEKGEKRTVYSQVFFHEESGRKKGLLTIVDTADGEAFDLYRYPAKKVEKRYGNRKVARMGEQPPPCVLQAIAAAGHLPDCF